MTAESARPDVLESVTAAIIEALERGVMPWRKPWKDVGRAGQHGPHNGISGKQYNGVNWIQLTMAGMRYTSNAWLTFKQAQAAGGTVRRGEHGVQVILWKPTERTARDEVSGNDVTKRGLYMRTYTVFNLDQCDGVTLPKRRNAPTLRVVSPDEMGAARQLVDKLGITVRHEGNRACYSPAFDLISMPTSAQFESVDHYRATLAHECVHATGAKDRLDRDLTGRFGTDAYCVEELCAELGAAMIGARLGFDSTLLAHHAGYLASWLRVLKADSKAILTAASKASAACNYLCGVEVSEAEEEAESVALAA